MASHSSFVPPAVPIASASRCSFCYSDFTNLSEHLTATHPTCQQCSGTLRFKDRQALDFHSKACHLETVLRKGSSVPNQGNRKPNASRTNTRKGLGTGISQNVQSHGTMRGSDQHQHVPRPDGEPREGNVARPGSKVPRGKGDRQPQLNQRKNVAHDDGDDNSDPDDSSDSGDDEDDASGSSTDSEDPTSWGNSELPDQPPRMTQAAGGDFSTTRELPAPAGPPPSGSGQQANLNVRPVEGNFRCTDCNRRFNHCDGLSMHVLQVHELFIEKGSRRLGKEKGMVQTNGGVWVDGQWIQIFKASRKQMSDAIRPYLRRKKLSPEERKKHEEKRKNRAARKSTQKREKKRARKAEKKKAKKASKKAAKAAAAAIASAPAAAAAAESQSSASAPAESQASAPAESQASARTESQALAPAELQAPAPAEPEASAPAEPQASAPTEPQASAPAEPQASAPAELQAPAPAEPEASAPAEPQASAPAEPQASASAMRVEPSSEPVVQLLEDIIEAAAGLGLGSEPTRSSTPEVVEDDDQGVTLTSAEEWDGMANSATEVRETMANLILEPVL